MTTVEPTERTERTREDVPDEAGPELQDSLEQGAERAREMLRAADEVTRDFVRRQPVAAIGGALLAGYLIGRLFSRS